MLLDDIIKATTNDNTPLSTLLRMCAVLGYKLGNQRLKSWATQELNGYSLQTDVPEYRVVPAGAVGTFVGPGWSQVTRNVPSFLLDKEHRESAEVVRICEPVRSLEHMLQTKEKGQIVYSWNANLVARYQGSIMEHRHMIDAHQEVPKGAIAGVLDSIRNRVLETALEIQGQGTTTDDDLAKVAADQKKSEQVDKTIVNIIYGGGNVYFAEGQSQISIAIIGAVLFCARALLTQSEHWSWKEYIYRKDGFAITLPVPPVPAHIDPTNPNMTVYTVHFTADSSFSIRADNEKRDCTATLNQLKAGALRNKQPKQPIDASSVKDVSVAGYSGVEYEFRFDPKVEAYERYVCVRSRFYIFSARWSIGQPRPAAVNRAVKSFRILEADSRR